MTNPNNRPLRRAATFVLTLVAVLALLPLTAAAQTRSTLPAQNPYYGYLYIPGVYGAAKSPYTNWHDVDSYAIEARKHVSGGRAYGSTMSPLTVGTDLGIALPGLTLKCATGQALRYVILRMFRTGETRYFAEFRLYNATIKRVQSRSEGQSIEFDYTKVILTQVDTTTGVRTSRTIDRATTGTSTGKSLTVPTNRSPDDFEVLVRVEGIPGKATRTGYRGWHTMESFQVGARAPVTTSRTTGTAFFEPFTLRSKLASLPEFAMATITGQLIRNVEIHVFDRSITRGPVLKVKLGDVLVCNATGKADEQTIQLDYSRVEFESFQGGAGSGQRVSKGGWNVRTNTAL